MINKLLMLWISILSSDFFVSFRVLLVPVLRYLELVVVVGGAGCHENYSEEASDTEQGEQAFKEQSEILVHSEPHIFRNCSGVPLMAISLRLAAIRSTASSA